MAKKDQERKIKYYESVRDHSFALIAKAEEALEQIESFGDDFSDVFEKTHKRHNSLLKKVAKLIERERKALGGRPKNKAKPTKTVKLPAAKAKSSSSKAKPITAKPTIAKQEAARSADGVQ